MAPIKIAEYLFARLRQLGVASVHGVPGDFNLNLLDYVEPAGLMWVGNTNELNAAYAADGYARIKGIGAIVTTFGVGELSALNGIAGAYAEFAPVVHIVGTPARHLQDGRVLMHHTLNDGNYRRFSQIYEQVSSAQARIWDPTTATKQIDEVLATCLRRCRPVYIELPTDLVETMVSDERLASPIAIPQFMPASNLETVLTRLLSKIKAARQPIIYVDGESRPMRIIDNLQCLVSCLKWPTWTSPFGRGLLDETEEHVHGVYRGEFADEETRRFYLDSDLILCFGPHFSGTNTYQYTSIPDAGKTIFFTFDGIKFGSEHIRDISPNEILIHLLEALKQDGPSTYKTNPVLSRPTVLPIAELPKIGDISQDKLWPALANLIAPGDIVFGETGTPSFGVLSMPLPQHSRAFTHVTWLSIGYMLPAAQGAALAQRELIQSSNYKGIRQAKTILFIGDGSFQMTAQELSTIIRHDLNVMVFVINNDGYSIERFIHGRQQSYNDIAPWRYLEAPSFFGASNSTYTASAKTWIDLKALLEDEALRKAQGPSMVEIVVDREDAPPGQLRKMLDIQIKREVNGA